MKVYCILILLALRVDRVFSTLFEDKLPDIIPTASEWGWRDLKVTLMKRYQFEGVDYEALPTLPPAELAGVFKEEGNKFHDHDCQEQMERCITMIPYAYEVCAFVPKKQQYWNIYSPCQVDFVNCRHRVKFLGQTLFGDPTKDMWNQITVLYEGTGRWCATSRRMMLISDEDIEYERHMAPIIRRHKKIYSITPANRTIEVLFVPKVASNV